ncbi:DUF3397 domain-containing protein [Psychrobacillus insolitus]|uniref:DUF3397 domain-containing protein n=1 Tax=Psychrobacillus insolitus TaxID=1461 RepID=UPI003CCC59B4
MLPLFILFPAVLFITTFIVGKYFLHKRKKALGIAVDVTTVLLFISVSYAFFFVFQKDIILSLIICALLIATVFTYIDWKTKKEIELVPLFRKIWRTLFLLLCSIYAFVCTSLVIRYVLLYIS